MVPGKIFTSVLVVTLLGCTEIACNDGEVVDHFPNRVGTTWEYSVCDSSRGRQDTVVVSVTGRTVVHLPTALPAAVWTIDYPDHREERYAVEKGDTVEVYEKTLVNTTGWMEARYVFPLRVGGRWTVPPCGGSLLVDARDVATTNAGSFNNAYRLVIDQSCNNDHFEKTEWVVPAVGVVRRDLQYWGTNESWVLIYFSD